MSSLVLCLTSEKKEVKINAMECVLYLSAFENERKILSGYDVFNICMNNLITSIDIKDQDISFAAIAAIGNFSGDKGYWVLLANSNKIMKFFELLLKSI